MTRILAMTVVLLTLAGCSDPMDKVSRLSDVELAEDAPTAEIAEPASEAEAPGGLFARLLRPKSTALDAPADAPAAPAADVTASAEETASTPAPERRGLFGLFGGQNRAPATETEAEVELASLDPDAAATGVTDTPDNRGGVFARRSVRIDADAPDARLVAPGTVLPYGEVARVCDMPRRDMGREVAKYPERRAQYRLYDSAPGNTAPHTFYMTGFPDGCARQFTAALALFGSPSMHEQLRYGAPAESLPYSSTDKAYEKIKRRVCGVGRNKPCGRQISQLERDTAFVSIYERFGDNARWATILLHDGQVVARDMKSGR